MVVGRQSGGRRCGTNDEYFGRKVRASDMMGRNERRGRGGGVFLKRHEGRARNLIGRRQQ